MILEEYVDQKVDVEANLRFLYRELMQEFEKLSHGDALAYRKKFIDTLTEGNEFLELDQEHGEI